MLYRIKIWLIILHLAGIIFIYLGLRSLIGGTQILWASVMIAIGIYYLTFIPRRIRAIGKSTFSGKPDELPTTIQANEQMFEMNDTLSTSSVSWDGFVDYRICKNGMLLYPQKLIFLWIPDSAEVTGGTWQDFQQLVSTKITRKI